MTETIDQAPLFSQRFVMKLTAGIAGLCALTIAISFAGRQFGDSMVLAGHTADETPVEIVIGEDVLTLPANVIRFEAARKSGVQDAVDTYFVWPGMLGYSDRTRKIFDQTETARGLIFAQAAQATMSRDMSGRFEPIYKRLIEGAAIPGPGGLVSYRIRSGSGYQSELLYVDPEGGIRPYTVRCLNDSADQSGFSTRTGCQRDIFLGQDLSVTYRFSIDLLPQWKQIEQDVRDRFTLALSEGQSTQ
ncbi:MAG: hypothetical protein CML29_12980 [Rhizobiales bacterium]|nr:hypothetical protein [Hyphomicrobiales bacterium]MBG18565.1 hypothetical protein [Hyphomicrobiales bacterium]|tara:strand:+ start:287 stop:1024 length:738 start_codon:yes stop_codon:yes gene_type:complete